MSKQSVTAIQLMDTKTTDIAASSVIDMKVSKSDLFDLVINEAETELEAELERSHKVYKTLDEKWTETAVALVKSKAQKDMDSVRTFAKLTKCESEVELNPSVSHCGDTMSLSFRIQLGKLPRYYDDESDAVTVVLRRDVEANATLKKLLVKVVAMQDEVCKLQGELQELRSQTKRMKTQVVRSILQSSSEGQHVLSGLDTMKKRFRAERQLKLTNGQA